MNAEKALNPIELYIKGMPCMYGDAVGRLVAVHPIGEYVLKNGTMSHTHPIFMTPHGTALNPTIAYISKITNYGMQKLLIFEAELNARSFIPKGELKTYDGYLTEKEYLDKPV